MLKIIASKYSESTSILRGIKKYFIKKEPSAVDLFHKLMRSIENNDLRNAFDLLQRLTEKNKLNQALSIENRNGQTALLYACQENNLSMIILILNYTIAARIPVDTEDSEGATPLIYAAKNNNEEAMEALLNNGANPQKDLLWVISKGNENREKMTLLLLNLILKEWVEKDPQSTIRPLARFIISEIYKQKIKTLNLKGLSIGDLPMGVFLSLDTLTNINLRHCNLSSLPSDLRTLTDLEYLDITFNQLPEMEISKLPPNIQNAIHKVLDEEVERSFSRLG